MIKINLVWFQYNGLSRYCTKPTYVGVIAQELQKISPYMVSVSNKKMNNGATGYLEVDNSAMAYMLINSVKEQQKLMEVLTKQNELLQKRLEHLETLIKK